jgi:peptidoglycan hydrolase CwlO-like protein
MEQIILQILEKNISITQLLAIFLTILIFLIKSRKTDKKIKEISDNHLTEILSELKEIKKEIKDGFEKIDEKVSKIGEDVIIIKDRQERIKN